MSPQVQNVGLDPKCTHETTYSNLMLNQKERLP